MAFSKTPVADTYSTDRLPVTGSFSSRYGSAGQLARTASFPDAGLTNVIPKKITENGQEIAVIETRPPLRGRKVADTLLAAYARGCYVWEKTTSATYYYAVWGNKVYTSTDAITWTAVTTLSVNSATPVGFSEFISSANVKSLVMVDGVDGYVFTDNTAGTKIVDVDFPTPHVPNPVVIDAYLFLAKAGTGDIYNSDLDNPASWTAGSFISSELYPDDVKAIAKVKNYLLAVGSSGCEFFYDNANPTASPLARYEGASLPFGTVTPYTLATNKSTCMLLTSNSEGGLSFRVIDGFKDQEISAPWLLDMLNYEFSANGLTPSDLRGYFVRLSGDLYYVLYLSKQTGDVGLGFAMMYSFDLQTWVRLGYDKAGSVETVWPVAYSAGGSSNDSVTFVQGYENNNPGSPMAWFGTWGVSKVVSTFSTYPTAEDNFNVATSLNTYKIVCSVQTSAFDFGSLNRKVMYRAGLLATVYNYGKATGGVVTSAVPFYISYTDNDYATFSTERTITIDPYSTAESSNNFPFLTQLGSFRQRAFKIRWGDSSNSFVRLRAIEVDINKGQQ
jgi:hypothetical protein